MAVTLDAAQPAVVLALLRAGQYDVHTAQLNRTRVRERDAPTLGASMSPLAKRLMVIAVVAAVYYVGGRLGLQLAFVHQSASAVWPPTGIALAALLVLGVQIWPAIAIAAFAVNLATSGLVVASLGIAAGNTLEALVGAYLVNRFAGGRDAFERAENVLRYTLYAGVIACSVSATIGISSLKLAGLTRGGSYGDIWLTWWMGDLGGALVLAPMLLLWSRPWRIDKKRTTLTEAVAVVLFAIAAIYVVFGPESPIAQGRFPVAYISILPAVWMAMRFGRRVTAIGVVALAVIAVVATIAGRGVFAAYSPTISLLLVQAFVICTAVISLAVAAAVYERRQAEAELKASHEQLEQRVLQRTGELFAANAALREEITQRQQAESELQKNEARLRSLVESIDDVAFEFDRDANYVNIWTRNPNMLPRPKQEMLGRRAGSFLGAAFAEPFLAAFHRVLHSGHSESIEYSMDLSGERRWFLGRINRITDAAGKGQSICLLVREITDRKRAEEATQRLSRRLLQLQDEERRRMARELHDSTAQQLAALEMQLTMLDEHARELSAGARAALKESHDLAESATREVRTLSYLLHPPLLDEVGLASALDWYAEGFAKRSRIETDLDLPQDLGRLPRDVEMAVFRIVQESLVNVHRHSGGSRASIKLTCDNGHIVLEVADDGRGLDAGKVRDDGGIVGVGITGMRERVRQLGGQLEIASSAKGTTVKARIPLA